MKPLEIESLWRARAIIDLDSLHHNIDQIRLCAPGSRLMAVIKADAYGHGLATVCKAIHKYVDGFAVATIAEGIQCRNVQKDKPVIVLSELWQPRQLRNFDEYKMDVVVHSQQQVKWLEKHQGPPLSVWIKIDSGMNRLGIELGKVVETHATLANLGCVRSIRVMSHLANADVVGDNYTRKQLLAFNSATAKLECEKSLANSAGVMRWPDCHYSWIRPGLILYGAAPYVQQGDSQTRHTLDLRPVMQLQARLIAVKMIDADQPVGYGGVYRTLRKTRIAMVGLGYGDGYPRLVDTRACVLIAGKRAPVIGRISMDMITVDITDLDDVEVGDEVTLWGHGLPVEEVAQWAGTIPYELLCKVTTRIPRVTDSRQYYAQ